MGYVTAVRILDEESLQACAAYVDLNPERAVLAETLEASDYTSVQHRITSLKENAEAINDSNAVNAARITNRADDFLSPISIDEKNDPLSSQPSRKGKRCSDKGFLDGRMSHASPMNHASKSFPRRRESSGVRVMTRDFAMVAKMSFMNTTRLTQRINVLKDPLVKIIASSVALPVVENHAFGNIQMCFIANFDVHRQFALLQS